MDLNSRREQNRRQFCYYTQFAPPLAASANFPDNQNEGEADRILSPLVHYLYGRFHSLVQLYRMLRHVTGGKISFSKVSAAYERAVKYKQKKQIALKELYDRESRQAEPFHVVLLGRPYTVLSKHMNKGIPDIFGAMGIKVFYQDMLTITAAEKDTIAPLLSHLHWHYAAEIVKAAARIAETPGAYPVLITSFKCTPDAFVVQYFKKIMDRCDKPYLILQLDEHDSSVGYETRIEAATRSFKNHHLGQKKTLVKKLRPVMILKKASFEGKTLVIPNWGDISQRLVVANLRRAGIDARLLEERVTSIRKSLRHNTGQCLPLNIIGQEFIDFIRRYDLDPADCVLWMIRSGIPCNLGLFPYHLKHMLDDHGGGFEAAQIFSGVLSFGDVSKRFPLNMYFAFMFGGLVKKMGCRIRPYETTRGETDAVVEKSMVLLEDAFLGNRKKMSAVDQVVQMFKRIAVQHDAAPRPKVAIFGDLYARDNEMFNQDLIHQIEGWGGEVVTTPYSSLVKMIVKPYLRKWFVEGDYVGALSSKAVITAVTHLEKKYYKKFKQVLGEAEPDYDDDPQTILAKYRVRIENTGESMENLMKIHYIVKHHPDIALFVQTSPAFCCPSLVTEAMARHIERQTGVPVVSITYDGTGGRKNEPIIPYLYALYRSPAQPVAAGRFSRPGERSM
jgi:predicted nucleotide-binding protein (sugar kinase/HSP70/actin superfamily)